ncbi:pseudouridine synthase [Coniella lustricola]|uniref:Pseudouridine synthase n=1 Tax=Coniella lustricola TaxID=2025994 RepID=A0A2T3AFA8_9PEZI|nr:pseudouridine synthase [Coniella lustricola]
MASPHANASSNQPANFLPSVRAASEKKLGMLHHISPANHGWHGDVRKRLVPYTDFLVNEIRKDGQVLHLEDYNAIRQPTNEPPSNQSTSAPSQESEPAVPTVSAEDEKSLQDLLGQDTTAQLKDLLQRIIASGMTRLEPKANRIKFPPMERETRGKAHHQIRRIFQSRIQTETDSDGIIVAVPAHPHSVRQPRAKGGGGGGGRNSRNNQQPSFKKLGGDYLHFTLYKENKDTMEAVNHIARMTKTRSAGFGFAGTKDRRAATVQRVSAFRIPHETLDSINAQVPGLKMGDYKYSKYPIQLGDHGGNEFNITIKNVEVSHGADYSLERRVQITKQAVETAVNEMVKYGFINYFGLQRFGTHALGTHELGKMILNERFSDVIDGILHVDDEFKAQVTAGSVQETPANRDELNRVRAMVHFREGDTSAALRVLPKRFSAESSIIQHLDKQPRDFQGALRTVSRGMRSLYLHAYQSFVWNHAASYRWAKYGSKVIAGDLVLIHADNGDAEEESEFQRARALSAEEADSGKYTIFDVVLPGPGFDVLYPANDVGDFYVEFMARPENGQLDPHRMRRSKKDFTVSGNYRFVVSRLKGEPKWEVRTYVDDNDQMVPTDLDLIEIRKAAAAAAAAADEQAAKTGASAQAIENGNSDSNSSAVQAKGRRLEDDAEAKPRTGGGWTQASENGNFKRVKLMEAESRPDTPESVDTRDPHGGGAPLWTDCDKPIRNPVVTALASATAADTDNSSSDDESKETQTLVENAPANVSAIPDVNTAPSKEAAQTEPKASPMQEVVRPARDAFHAFGQPDLSGHKEEEIQIAVVLRFSLGTSSYATVVLRELMAEIVPEEPGSPLYPQ